MSLRTLVAATVLISASAFADEPIAQSGEENYEQFCAACHGESGTGDGPVAGSLTKAVPDLTQIAKNNDGVFPFKEVRSRIDGRWDIEAHGTKMMPVWGYEFWMAGDAGNFEEENVLKILNGIVEYIESLQQ